jgi:hypothetical protein
VRWHMDTTKPFDRLTATLKPFHVALHICSNKLQGSPSMVKGVESLQDDAEASGAYPLGVRGFKSHPLHCFVVVFVG